MIRPDSKQRKLRITYAIAAGIIVYLSKFARGYFSDNDAVLFILGFLPNAGLAFALPFIYAANRIRLHKPVKHFAAACLITLLLMILNEIRDKYQSGRVFDWYDIYASAAAVAFAFLLYRKFFLANEPMTRD